MISIEYCFIDLLVHHEQMMIFSSKPQIIGGNVEDLLGIVSVYPSAISEKKNFFDITHYKVLKLYIWKCRNIFQGPAS